MPGRARDGQSLRQGPEQGAFKDETGKWAGAPTPYRPGEEAKARRYIVQLQADIAAQQRLNGNRSLPTALPRPSQLRATPPAGSPIEKRSACVRLLTTSPVSSSTPFPSSAACAWTRSGLATYAISCWNFVRPAQLAPRTIRHVYAILTTMFRNAVADELILATPCVLPKGVLPEEGRQGSRVARERHLHPRGGRAADLRPAHPRGPPRALRPQGPGRPPPRRGRRPALAPVRPDPASRSAAFARPDEDPGPPARSPSTRRSPACSPSGSWPGGSAPTAARPRPTT